MNQTTTKATRLALLCGVIGNGIWGCSFLASKIALSYVNPTNLLVIRFGISLLVMSVLILLGKGDSNLRKKNILPLILLGICQPVVYFLFETYGIMYSTSSFCGIMIGLIPVASAIAAAIFLGEKLSKRAMVGILFCIAGVVVISLSEKSEGTVTLVGVLCLLGAILTATIYNTVNKRYSQTYTAFERTYLMMVIGFIAFFGMSLVESGGTFFAQLGPLFTNPSFVAAAIYLSVFSSVIAFFCVNYSITYLTVQQASSFNNLTPVVSVIAGVLILSEPFTGMHLAGMALILIGIFSVNR